MNCRKTTCAVSLIFLLLAVSTAIAIQPPKDDSSKFASRKQIQTKARSVTSIAPSPVRSAASTRTVTGHRIGHYKDGPVPLDLSIRTVAAYIPTGGTYSEIDGVGNSDGTFSISGVPKGFYLLRLGGQYLWTSNTKVNADYFSGSRSTATPPVNETTLTLSFANLNPWQETDFFELSDPRASAFALFTTADGAAAMTGTFPYTSNLNDSTQGDKTYIQQLITQSVGGFAFAATGRYFKPRDFVQSDGGDTALSGTLETVVQDRTFRANIRGADLAALAVAVNPRAVLTDTSVALDPYQGSLAKGFITASPDLVAYSLGTGETPMLTVNQDFGDVPYGNPFPKNWPLFSVYQYLTETNYLLPGTTNPVSILCYLNGNTTILPSESNPIAALIGPVTNPTVGGFNFFANETGMGLTPVVAWTPPSAGTAHLYGVYVYELDSDGDNTVYTQIARLLTQNMSITIPPGLLNPGVAYVFLIRAWYRPGVDIPHTPYALGPIGANADVLSGLMYP